MEPLLALSFGNISSRDAVKIRKGLRQIEGLLAQICLSSPAGSGRDRRASVVDVSATGSCVKKLDELNEDPAFLEFFRLQDGFECNVATHLITCLERLLSMPPNSSNDMLLLSALHLLQGMLILHPPSRTLFSREIYMNLLLDLLPPSLPPAIQSSTLSTLILTLIDNPPNARVFESVDGLLAVSALLQDSETSRVVKKSALELLYLYLLPEDPQPSVSPPGSYGRYATDTVRLVNGGEKRGRRAGSKGSNSSKGSGDWSEISELDGRSIRRSKEAKQKMLAKYLDSAESLPSEFRVNGIFDGVAVA